MAIGKTAGLSKSVKSTAAIAVANTIAKFGADDDTMSIAAAVTDNMVGIFQHITSAAGKQVEVMLTGISDLKIAGTVTRGDLITSNASGQGVTAAPAAGVNNNVVGTAMRSGVTGDVIPVLLGPSQIQG